MFKNNVLKKISELHTLDMYDPQFKCLGPLSSALFFYYLCSLRLTYHVKLPPEIFTPLKVNKCHNF